MQKSVKKIISVVFMIFILYGQTASADITGKLSASSTSQILGQPIKITATINKTKGGQTISFFAGGKDISFSSNGKCIIPIKTTEQDVSCSVSFTSFEEGTFKINANVYQDNKIIYSIEGIEVSMKSNYKPVTISGDASGSVTDTNTTYMPLAPIPGTELDGTKPVETSENCTLVNNPDGTVTKTNCTNPCPFGNYLNIMIKIIIGFAAVLAMIMIVMGGVEYMTSELVSRKEEGKERIIHAILGLVIALSAYLILNTLNPALLNACLNNLPVAKITIDPELELNPWDQFADLTGSTTNNCPEGYTNVNVEAPGNPSKINVCKSISDNLNKMIIAAKNNNPSIILSGWGSRTYNQQVALRLQNGCPDKNSSPSTCKPPTARPGYSNHEAGKAIDFNCNGQKMTQNGSCFIWLTQNANKYGLKNLNSEPWHWSVDGN